MGPSTKYDEFVLPCPGDRPVVPVIFLNLFNKEGGMNAQRSFKSSSNDSQESLTDRKKGSKKNKSKLILPFYF
jgi:hypothetical protein